MKTVHFRCMLAGALAPIAGLLIATPAAADLILNFDNGRPDASTLPAYITFTGAPQAVSTQRSPARAPYCRRGSATAFRLSPLAWMSHNTHQAEFSFPSALR